MKGCLYPLRALKGKQLLTKDQHRQVRFLHRAHCYLLHSEVYVELVSFVRGSSDLSGPLVISLHILIRLPGSTFCKAPPLMVKIEADENTDQCHLLQEDLQRCQRMPLQSLLLKICRHNLLKTAQGLLQNSPQYQVILTHLVEASRRCRLNYISASLPPSP